VTSLAANVASLAAGLGAVTGDMTGLVAVIAALHRKAAGIVTTLRAAARHVTSLVAIVTTQLRSLLTVFRDVTDTVAAIAKILILLALARKVSELVAFEALLSASSKTAVPITSTISSSSTTALWALPCKVAHAITFVART